MRVWLIAEPKLRSELSSSSSQFPSFLSPLCACNPLMLATHFYERDHKSIRAKWRRAVDCGHCQRRRRLILVAMQHCWQRRRRKLSQSLLPLLLKAMLQRLQRLSSLALTLHRFQLAVSIIFQLFSVSSASSSSICDASTFRFEFTAITNYKQRKLQHQQQQRVKLAIIFLPRWLIYQIDRRGRERERWRERKQAG